MAKYRVKQRFYYDDKTDYEVQKKVWYIPFWYNFNNIDGSTTGFYDTFEEAKKAINHNKFNIDQRIIHIR
jgi:hypothetical protein